MGRGEGNTPVAGHLDHGGRGRFRGEAVNRLELDHPVSQRPDDPPAAGGRARGHGQRANHLDPDLHLELRGVEEVKPRRQGFETRRAGRGEEASGR